MWERDQGGAGNRAVGVGGDGEQGEWRGAVREDQLQQAQRGNRCKKN